MKKYCLPVMLMLCVSCGAQTLTYEPASEMPYTSNGVAITAELVADIAAGKVTASLSIANNSDAAVLVAPYMFQLAASGIMTPPVELSTDEDIPLSSGESVNFSLVFLPVNNQELYQQFEIPGDLLKEYYLGLTGILTKDHQPLLEDTLVFSVSDDAYASYRKKYGSEEGMLTYTLSIDEADFIEKQYAYMKEAGFGIHLHEEDHGHEAHDHAGEDNAHEVHQDAGEDSGLMVVLAGDEVVLQDRAVKSGAFFKDGILNVYLRIFNRGEVIVVDSQKLAVSFDDNLYTPLNDFSGLETGFPAGSVPDLPDTQLAVPRNERVILRLQYAVENAPDSFSLGMNGIMDNNIPILCDSLKFERK